MRRCKSGNLVLCIPYPPLFYLNGTYVGLAAAECLSVDGKLHSLRPDPVFAASVTTESPVQKISVKQTTMKQSNGGTTMKKELMSEGMMCQNCVKHVTHALEGVSWCVPYPGKSQQDKATRRGSRSVTGLETLGPAVTEAGYRSHGIIPMKADKAHITRSIKIARGQLVT